MKGNALSNGNAVSTNGDRHLSDAESLIEQNIAELNRGISDLVVHNESRMALLRDQSNPWIEFQFEMMSFKLDVILDALVRPLPDPELRMAEYGIDFQLKLSKLLDNLFPHTAPAESADPNEGND